MPCLPEGLPQRCFPLKNPLSKEQMFALLYQYVDLRPFFFF